MPRTSTILAVLLALGLAVASPASAGLLPGAVAPDFRGTDLDGFSHRLSDYRGKVVVLFVLGNT